MKSKKQQAVALEAELARLNELVRARRKQLTRLEDCPHTDCECRAVWREVVDKKLKAQVRKVRRSVRGTQATKPAKKAKRG